MKNVFTFISILIYTNLFAQIPNGYYDSANGLSGSALKNELNNIIDNHTEFEYTASSTDVWDILKEADRDPNNSSNVILIYTGKSVDAAQEYNSGSGWSREHVWAKSRGDFGTDLGPGTDVHHLKPADVSTNSARNNRWFAECSTPYLDGGTDSTGSYTSTSEWVWKPRDEVKGDVARMIFYMDTRYEGENGELDLEVIDYIPTDNNTLEPIHAKLSDLLNWHKEDPVDAFEQNRNNVIYSYQNNRNPYIDNPEYVNLVYNGPVGIAHLTEDDFNIIKENNKLFVNSIYDINSLTLFDVIGRKVAQTNSSSIELSNAGIFLLQITTSENRSIILKVN